MHDFVRWSGRSGCTTAIRFASKRRCVATTRACSWRSRSQRFASGLLPCAHAGAGISAHVGKPGWQARQVIFKGWCRCPRHHTQLPARKIHDEIPKCALSNFSESETLKEKFRWQEFYNVNILIGAGHYLEVVRMDPPLPIEVESSSILDILRRLLLLLVALLLDALPLLELDDVSNTLLKLLL